MGIRDRMRRRDQSGATLLEVVIAVALFFIIGSSFVYAMTAVGNASGSSNDRAKNSMSQSGISRIFQDDIRNARAIKLSSATTLLLARPDGTCVNWTITKNALTGNIGRSTASNAVAPKPSVYLQEGIAGGGFSLSGNTVTLTVTYPKGEPLVESATPSVAGSDGGACWT